MGTKKSNRPRATPKPVVAKSRDIATWPTVWRVVAPRAGSYDHDMVFTETEKEGEARKSYGALRRAGYPVRLEYVCCGPLPKNAMRDIGSLRASNAQNPRATPRPVLGFWMEARP